MCAARAAAVLVAGALLAAGGAGAESAEERPALHVEAPAAAVSVGDRVSVRVTASGGADWRWGEPSVAESDSWAVAAAPQAMPGSRPPVWELVLVPLAVGEQSLPSIRATARPPGGEPVPVAAAELPEITVASVLPPGEEVKPAPLRDPVGVRGFPWEWVVPWALALLPLAAAGGWWLRRRRRGGVESAVTLLPPLAELEARLADLENALARGEPVEAWCDDLAAAFRRFLERRSGEPAREMTSFELRALARRVRWPESSQRALHRVMTVVDGVRFSRRPAAAAELRAALAAAADAARDLDEHLAAGEAELEAAS